MDKKPEQTPNGTSLGPWHLWLLFLGLVVVPILLSAATASIAFERSQSVDFCASCHVMKPYVDNLRDQNSELLAAKHFLYRRINYNQCYACHSDYDFLGPVKAKLRGMRHVAVYYFGFNNNKPIHLYHPSSNTVCLQCHEHAKSFVRNEAHKDIMDQIHSNELSCISCHGPVHPSSAKPT